MFGVEVAGLEVAGLSEPLSFTVPIGRIRAIVSPERRIARAIADAVTGLAPHLGRVSINGPAGRQVRLAPSDGALLPHLTVLENIMSARRERSEQEWRAKAAQFGLDGLLDRYPHEIPVGRRRMAGLARALHARPDAVVLEDELGTPSWGALLATAWRGYEVRPRPVDRAEPDRAGRDEPDRAPDLLVAVAAVLIVPTVDRARGFDARPIVPALLGDGDSRRAG
jgi:hypothetical protein